LRHTHTPRADNH
jgi:hypothetical protein